MARALATVLALCLAACAAGDDATADAATETDGAAREIRGDGGRPDASDPDDATPDAHAGDGGADAAAADAALPACSDGVDNDGDGRIDADDRGCSGPDDDDESGEIALPECSDGEDNDADGLVDLDDPDCTSDGDPRESGGVTGGLQCSNGADDDGNGLIDWPEDPGCAAAGDDTESSGVAQPACNDEIDNDEDGLTDWPADPGCQGRGDGSEADPVPPPACANGRDDDGDGATDWPADDGCSAAGDFDEAGPCGQGVEVVELVPGAPHDGDLTDAPARTVGSCGGAAGGERLFRYRADRALERLVFSTAHPETAFPTVLYLRRACAVENDLACGRGTPESPGATLAVERPARGDYYVFVDTGSRMAAGAFRLTVEAVDVPACRNGLDDDGDGLIDNADPGCAEADDPDETDPAESPACANGLDDDGDGHIDHPADPDCVFAGGDREAPVCAGDAPLVALGQAGGQVELPVAAGPGGATSSCDAVAGPEAVIVLRLDTPSDVTVDVTENGQRVQNAIHARTACSDPETELACRAGQRNEPFVLRNAPRGTLYLLIEQGFLRPVAPRVATVTVESVLTECNDELDNDGDGLIDLDDPGCEHGRDPSEIDPPEVPACADGIDNEGDGLIDREDRGCVAAGDPTEGGCEGDPLWRRVECQTAAWVWSSDRARALDLAAAAQHRVLWTGCRHAGDNDDGLCSLDGTGWVSTDTFPMQGCDATWYHIGGRHTGNCGGHDGDTVRRLVLDEDDCWDYRAEPGP